MMFRLMFNVGLLALGYYVGRQVCRMQVRLEGRVPLNRLPRGSRAPY